MQNDDAVYIGHMLDTARRAVAKVEGLTREDYDADDNLQLALAHMVQIIGEAAGHVNGEARDDNPDIPWRQVIGIRHRIVHDYMHVDFDILWEVVTRNLPDLIVLLEAALPPESAGA